MRKRGASSPPTFVFANFNKHDKLEPLAFGLWCNILRRVPGSVLWLLHAKLDGVEERLRGEAAARGVHPSRLVFLPRVPKAQHLARHSAADLFLDTFFYGAHSTATDALRGGLPVLSCPGGAFARRVGSSLLGTAGGLQPLLLSPDLRDFEAIAVRLALDAIRHRTDLAAAPAVSTGHGHAPPKFSGDDTRSQMRAGVRVAPSTMLGYFRADLTALRLGEDESPFQSSSSFHGIGLEKAIAPRGPLFDTDVFTIHMERACALMWEVYEASGRGLGAGTYHIAVSSVAST